MELTKTKKAVVSKECVACGTCIKVCTKNALSIYRGLYALVDDLKCVGCGMCKKACPASVIEITEEEIQK